ncbi:sugar phosphate isomerase/epimerase family protein [Brachybacterium sp. J153]|uniref:sugar phosphate isomerase/epimerase family protein n=1 Tax=Brachybacterium sp. J153 TaxID=3116488 RepID=UPI002E7854DD|nr:sugar phosphate isomerase/epimerase family protein [Brachybacterium sp. J153]MEE1617751.1 sugar phosphate isomerase/epimerase family protein [Brachybacterium sp. J153]
MNVPPSERIGHGTPRLSINRWTCRTTPVQEFLETTASHGIDAVGLWRQDVAEVGLDALRRRVDDAGLRVSTLCRGGFLTASSEADRAAALEDNRRAIDEAAGLGAPTLVLVVGGVDRADKDIVGARSRVTEAIAELAPYAEERGVTLSLEPLHPMFAADRAVLSTIDQALDMAEASGSPAAGVVVDTYHVWWDPYLERAIERAAAAGRLFSYQVCDWNLPLAAEPLNSRGYMGDGYIDFPSITSKISAAGYTGDIEVEIFHEDVWATPVDEALRIIAGRFEELVLPHA